MVYSIFVFNTKRIEQVDPRALLTAITASNYYTLCDQYGLDPALIEPTLAALKVIDGGQELADYFVLEYRPQGRCPIVVYLQEPSIIEEKDLSRLRESAPQAICEVLDDLAQVVQIELDEEQLSDLGLLLGYELGRCAAESGKGVVLGLDGTWYHLNRHKAFLPVV